MEDGRAPVSHPTTVGGIGTATSSDQANAASDVIQQAADESPLLAWVRDLLGYLKESRTLTDRGNLHLADGRELVARLGTSDLLSDDAIGYKPRSSTQFREVDFVYRLSIKARFLHRRSGRVARSRAADVVDTDPAEAIHRLLRGMFSGTGPTVHVWGEDTYGWGWFAKDLDDDLGDFFVSLLNFPSGVAIDRLGDVAWARMNERYDLRDIEPFKLEFQEHHMRTCLRTGLNWLARAGVLRINGLVLREREHGEPEETAGAARLSALGEWSALRLVDNI